MNKLTKEIITQILMHDQNSWDKKTRELRINYVLKCYHDMREARFYDEVLFPRMLRAYRMMIAWGIFPENEFAEISLGVQKEITGLWADNPEIADLVAERLCSDYTYTKTGVLRDTYISNIWHSEEWAQEEPTIEEINALGIKPSIVPSKRGQPALF